jgi:hypothetical protein
VSVTARLETSVSFFIRFGGRFFAWPRSIQQSTERVTGRTLLAMLIFVGLVAAVMWFFILPTMAGIKPTLP